MSFRALPAAGRRSREISFLNKKSRISKTPLLIKGVFLVIDCNKIVVK